MIMKKIIVCLAVFLFSEIGFAQNNFTLEIAGVKKQGGKLYISFFNSEVSFDKRKTYYSMVTDPTAETLRIPVPLPSGGYVISMYQDSNGNGKLDSIFWEFQGRLLASVIITGKVHPAVLTSLKLWLTVKQRKYRFIYTRYKQVKHKIINKANKDIQTWKNKTNRFTNLTLN